MRPLLQIDHLTKSFTIHHLHKTINVIQNLSLVVHSGEFMGIVGKSGSGKSTIIKCIYRTYLAQSGTILYDSHRWGMIDLLHATERQMVFLRKQEIGYVSQFLNVLPRTTALELVIQSLRETGLAHEAAQPKAQAILLKFDLPPSLWDNYPNSFSGGEKLRLNIACAIAKEPKLLLLDEPTASLDNESKLKVREVMQTLKSQGTTMIGIFHDLEFMEGLCDSVYSLNKGGLLKE